MKTTQIRIELTDDVYHLLKDDQQNRKNNSEKKVSLNDLVLEYFMVGLQTKLSGIENVADNSQQPNSNLPAVIMVKEKSLELAQKEQLFIQRENNIKYQESCIKADRQELREQEQDIRDQMQNLYQMKDEVAEEKEKIRQLKMENVEQVINTKILIQDNERKDEEIRKLSDQIIYFKETVLKALDKLDDKPDKNIWTDYVIPLLPTLISVAGFYLTNKNISENDHKLPIQGELEDTYNKLSPDDKEKLTKMLKDSIIKKFNLVKP